MFSDDFVPSPDKLRFYAPSEDSLLSTLQSIETQIRIGHDVINPKVFMPWVYWRCWIVAYIRAYMLTVHYDYYKQAGVVPAGFTPRKVSDLVGSCIPQVLLDAIREFLRPMVTPDGVMCLPHVNSFARFEAEIDPRSYAKNGTLVGQPDSMLFRYGIAHYPSLIQYCRNAYKGLVLCLGIKRESLSPKKFCVAFNKKEAKEKDSKVKVEVKDPVEHKGITTTLKVKYCFRGIEDAYDVPVDIKRPSYSYFLHDFKDSDVETANRILTPLLISTVHDYRNPIRVDEIDPQLAFLSASTYLGVFPYRSGEFYRHISTRLEGNSKIVPAGSLLARIYSSFTDELKEWHWPTLGKNVAKDVYTPKLSGDSVRVRQRRRGKKSSQAPSYSSDAPKRSVESEAAKPPQDK